MSEPIYLIVEQPPRLVRLVPTAYESEADFQALLAKFPELLAGEQIDPEFPRRWLLIAREAGVPEADGGSARWSLDHLFVDQDGTPTLVEVKRQSDSRLRREVVGQMMDYAANASRYWTPGHLEQMFWRTCELSNTDPESVLTGFLGEGARDLQGFWVRVHDRLQRGDMRLIFFSDHVPSELQRIVEFMNSQTRDTEVLAIEVKRYAGEGFATHIPRLFGQTVEARTAKVRQAGSRRSWTRDTFLAELDHLSDLARTAVRDVLAVGELSGNTIRWGTGSTTGSASLVVPGVHPVKSVVSLWTDGGLTLNFGWLDELESARAGRERLGQFASDVMRVGLDDNWRTRYVKLPADAWTPHSAALVALLAGMGD
jgi:hypothetical protein